MHRSLWPAAGAFCLLLVSLLPGCGSACSDIAVGIAVEPADDDPSLAWMARAPEAQPEPWRPGGQNRLPEGFPLAIPADAQVQAGATVGNGSERTWMATVLGATGLSASVAFYEKELAGRGLSVERHELVVEGRQMVTLAASAADREATVALSEAEEGVFAQISVRERGAVQPRPDPTPSTR